MPPNARVASFSRLWGIIRYSIYRKFPSPRFRSPTDPCSLAVHWAALASAFRRDGLAAMMHLRQIRDAASANLFQVTCASIQRLLLVSSLLKT
jgi:hypothetical protein